VWPRDVAPVDVHVVGLGKGEQKPEAERDRRRARGARADRAARRPGQGVAGVAFKDAELIGVPDLGRHRQGARRGQGRGCADRRSGEAREVALADLVETVLSEVRAYVLARLGGLPADRTRRLRRSSAPSCCRQPVASTTAAG
jgi:prolyl-tRNA synthetase